MTKGPAYFDHNATTPIDPIVLEAMMPFLTSTFGNPSSIGHLHGHEANAAVEDARAQVATSINASQDEIIFTGSCTEANNLALLGVAERAEKSRTHFVTSKTEHPSVLEVFRELERRGKQVTYLDVDEYGHINPDDVKSALRRETALVSIMAANNEVGTIQPLKEIGVLCESAGVLFHSDMAQVAAYCDTNVERDHIHLASLSGHKSYGPKGVGALYVRTRRPKVRLAPITYGGGQERGLRSGTINVAGVVGMGAAFGLARKRRSQDAQALRKLAVEIAQTLRDGLPDVELNGHPTERLANNLSFSIEAVEPHGLIRSLREVASFSASSACASTSVETSHVLLAMFGDTARARNAFRIGLGRTTTLQQAQSLAAGIVRETLRLRQILR